MQAATHALLLALVPRLVVRSICLPLLLFLFYPLTTKCHRESALNGHIRLCSLSHTCSELGNNLLKGSVDAGVVHILHPVSMKLEVEALDSLEKIDSGLYIGQVKKLKSVGIMVNHKPFV